MGHRIVGTLLAVSILWLLAACVNTSDPRMLEAAESLVPPESEITDTRENTGLPGLVGSYRINLTISDGGLGAGLLSAIRDRAEAGGWQPTYEEEIPAVVRLGFEREGLRADPQIMAWELREEGLACHCVCPMCGLGACGCIWASLHNIDVASAGPGLAEPDDRGIPLRSPPRSGSELDVAGVKQWDRITSVDDQAVRSPGELTTALRQHSIGEHVRPKIQHHDESREVVVRHASDLP